MPDASIGRCCRLARSSSGERRPADAYGVGRGLINTDRNNISPRIGFAHRLDNSNTTVLRGGFGIFHPTGAAQGARDIMSRNPFRYTIHEQPSDPAAGLHDRHADLVARLRQPGPRARSRAAGHLPVQPDARTRAAGRYRRPRQLRRLDDEEAAGAPGHATACRRAPCRSVTSNTDPAAKARLPFPIYGTFMDITQNAGEGQFNALQLELQRQYRGGLALNAAYTLAGSDSNAPDSGNSTIGVVQYDPYDIEKDRGPDPNVVKHRVVMNGTWDVPVGRERKYGGEPSLSGPMPSSAAGRCRRSSRRARDRTSRRTSSTAPIRSIRPTPGGRSTASASSARPGGPTSTATRTSAAAAGGSTI